MHYVIGCGGGGGFTTELLARTVPLHDICLIDGDTIEEKNLDRQMFTEDQIGMNKAHALAARFGIVNSIPEYFPACQIDVAMINPKDILFCEADNHACRRAVLEACDQYLCRAIIAANEYTDAEAYWYEPRMKNTPNDPRVLYPIILTDRSGDPLGPPGCTGVAQEENRQLALANDWGSAMAMQLYWFHTKERPELPRETINSWPVHHKVNKFAFHTISYGDRK